MIVRATRLLTFEEIGAKRNIVAVAIGPLRDIVVLSLDLPPGASRRKPDDAELRIYYATHPKRYRIHHRPGIEPVWAEIDLDETDEWFHNVQPLPSDHWLLVRSRAHGPSDPNAHVYDRDGVRRSSFALTHGVEDVQVTVDGQIWVSYFDEGVFNGSGMLSGEGLVCVDASGQPIFRFNESSLSMHDVPRIWDCYALNVASRNEVWLCYYQGFPLVRVRNGRIDSWWDGDRLDRRIHGTSAFSVGRGRVLFHGGYEANDQLFLVSLDTLQAVELRPIALDGGSIDNFHALGRGTRLYLETDDSLYVIDLNEVRV